MHRTKITVIQCTILCTELTLIVIKFNVHRTMCTVQSTMYTVHSTMYTVFQALNTEDSGQTVADLIN